MYREIFIDTPNTYLINYRLVTTYYERPEFFHLGLGHARPIEQYEDSEAKTKMKPSGFLKRLHYIQDYIITLSKILFFFCRGIISSDFISGPSQPSRSDKFYYVLE